MITLNSNLIRYSIIKILMISRHVSVQDLIFNIPIVGNYRFATDLSGLILISW